MMSQKMADLVLASSWKHCILGDPARFDLIPHVSDNY